MDSYLTLKLIHIFSAVILVGTGIGIAFFMIMAVRSNNQHATAVTARHVIIADWIFTTPSIVIQFISGIWLMKILDYTYTSTWFFVVITLFIFIGICWINVVLIQYKLRRLADSQIYELNIDKNFKNLLIIWTVLGVLALASILVMFWLMVFKPFPVY